ncbi:hypothetical protein [Pontibacter liquoris]|uniref:hypothetical protein n=1 Tax=Pontibacter liquoris TaxID=2905677 RepID=UPI001FA77276|nr:hypothetical protein [Pontibacter liquoris]
MSKETHTLPQIEGQPSTLFHHIDASADMFDVAPLLEIILDGADAPLEAAQHLEEAHTLLLDHFLKQGGYNNVWASNILHTLRQLRNGLLKGSKGIDLEDC